ncbi:YihY/virulence factor BrkB family protein [Rubrivirga sp. S365]|uniref:YihY/virulence factor BrkB family protein n=1 Tax=Rubrivirga sp. S365 TaxID=3076080 RepID=UPI0028CAA5B6|nr:YihY/virulence factor BrkB family protein [Rubrivirga sp. S365]MDT7858341.1 YihY/virulence factor BrkB family protein [Rubrivirga sp. S365]
MEEIHRSFSEDGLSLSAQATAYKLTVAAVPVVGLGLGLLNQFVGASARDEAVSVLGRLLPPQLVDGAVSALLSLSSLRGPLTATSAVGSVVTAVLVFSTFRRATERALRGGQRHGLAAVLFDARMAVQAGGLFAGAIAAALLVGTVGTDGLVERLLPSSAWAKALSGGVGNVLSVLLPGSLSLGVAAQVFRMVPRPRPPWRSVGAGALVTAVTWEIARTLLGVYLGSYGPLQVYNGTLTALGVVLAALLWAYLTGLALVLGAVVCRVHEDRAALSTGARSPQPTLRVEGKGSREAR